MFVEDVEADDRDEDDDEFRKEEESFEEVVRPLEELRVKRDDRRDILVCLLEGEVMIAKHFCGFENLVNFLILEFVPLCGSEAAEQVVHFYQFY